MDSRDNHPINGLHCPLSERECKKSCWEESFELPDGRTTCFCEDSDLLWANGKDAREATFPIQASTEYRLFDQWLAKKLSWDKDDTTHLDYVSPEKTTTACATIYNSLSHSIDPVSLIRSIDNNTGIRQLIILFHNAASREAIHCGPHWPVWQQKANYFFSPKAIEELMNDTSFKLEEAHPVEYLMHKNTIASKKSSHPRTAFWRGPVRSLIHRIGGRLNTHDAGHIVYLFSRDA
ncbi:MAG: hypothetical protein VXV82_05930 [Bacteroidota bacterium]|nr:hypothetical protein [Bacteroidota bacterium]